MAGGAYVALSGLRARVEQLNQLAADIANVGTAGYKSARTGNAASERPRFEPVLQSAIDVVQTPERLDFRDGTISPTGRDLDLAIEGRGFFEVETPYGPRYTRNGHFARRPDGTLTTEDGFAVLGEDGPLELTPGAVTVEADGTLLVGGTVVGRVRTVDFDDYRVLEREGGARFRAVAGATPRPAPDAAVRGSALEESNVSVPERIVEVAQLSRSFEALQRGLSVLLNDLDGRAITELGRR